MREPNSNDHVVVPFKAGKPSQAPDTTPEVDVSMPGPYDAKEMGARIREIRKSRNINQPDLAAKLGITKNAVTNWESGYTRPLASVIPDLCVALQCTPNELFNFPEKHTLMDDEARLVRMYRAATPTERKGVNGLLETLLVGHREAAIEDCKNNFMPIDIIELHASAGTGNYLDEWEPERETVYLRICRNVCRADAIVTVSGDSMLPTFKNGEEILIQRTDAVDPGEIGIFVVNGDVFVKEYQRDGLYSHNPKYETIHPLKDDSVYCLGRVLSAVTNDMRPTLQEQKILDEIHRER